jgi:ABC-type glycerol-3-phosphate transport system substrate-binding protein
VSDYVYVPDFISVPAELTNIQQPQLIDGKIYFAADVVIGQVTQTAGSGAMQIPGMPGGGAMPGGAFNEASEDETQTTDVTEPRLFTLSVDGSTVEEVAGFSNPAIPDSADDSASWSIDRMADAGDGCVWILESGYFGYFDEEDSYVDDTHSLLRKIELSSGCAVAELDASEILSGGGRLSGQGGGQGQGGQAQGLAMFSFANVSYFRCDTEGNLYIGGSDGTIYLVSSTGEVKGSVSVSSAATGAVQPGQPGQRGGMGGSLLDVVNTADGKAALLYRESDGSYKVTEIDFGSASLGADYLSTTSNLNNVTFAGIAEDGKSLLFYDSTSLFAIGTDGARSEAINWIDSDIDSSGVSVLGSLSESQLLCLTSPQGITFSVSAGGGGFGGGGGGGMQAMFAQSSNTNIAIELITLTKTPASEVVQKTVLTLAVNSTDSNLRTEILRFNKRSQSHRIKLVDYSQYNTTDDPTAGFTKLNTEIISGSAPDLFLTTNLPISDYAERGLLADLYPYLDADTELGGRDAIVPAFLNALDTEGKLYQVSSGFTITTLAGNAAIVGEGDGWTIDELEAVVSANPEAYIFSENSDREQVLQAILQYNLGEYVNNETGECSFDTPEFMALLDFVKNNFQSEAEEGQGGEYGRRMNDQFSALIAGTQLLQTTQLTSFDSFMQSDAIFNDSAAFKGFPCASREGAEFTTTLALAMSAKCSDKEGAWSFLRGILTSDYQSESGRGYTGGFPSNQSVFEARALDAMTEETEQQFFTVSVNGGSADSGGIDTDGDGEFDVYPKGTVRSPSSESALYYYAMTQERYERYMSYINSISRVSNPDSNINAIISEELELFFGGQKSAEDTAKLIQNRVSIYVNEHR